MLGVDITGQMDSAAAQDAQFKRQLREVAIEVNREVAGKLGINQSASITCVKPSGCATLDTKIKTTDGVMSFAEIFDLCGKDPLTMQDGDWVSPPVDIFVFDKNNEKKRITNLYIKGYAPVYEIEDENGNTYRFSSEHRLLTKSGWKYVRELDTNDEIVSFGSENTEVLNTSVSNQEELTDEARLQCKTIV